MSARAPGPSAPDDTPPRSTHDSALKLGESRRLCHHGLTSDEPHTAAVETDDFAGLFAAHYPRLVTGLRLAGATSAQAEDVAQEAFARTLGHWRRVRSGTNPAGYVSTVAFRLLRRQRRFTEQPLGDVDVAVAGPEDAACLAAGIRQALAAMPIRQRTCAALCLYLGLSPDDVAKALGIATGTVRTQLHRARLDLQAAIGSHLGGS